MASFSELGLEEFIFVAVPFDLLFSINQTLKIRDHLDHKGQLRITRLNTTQLSDIVEEYGNPTFSFASGDVVVDPTY